MGLSSWKFILKYLVTKEKRIKLEKKMLKKIVILMKLLELR